MTLNFFDSMLEAISLDSQREWAKKGAFTLGELSLKLKTFDENMNVVFNDGRIPDSFDSYRGYYEHVALDWGNKSVTNKDFINIVDSVIGKTFTGYKGGDFTMDKNTPIFVASYGLSTGDMITDVFEKDGSIILKVELIDV